MFSEASVTLFTGGGLSLPDFLSDTMFLAGGMMSLTVWSHVPSRGCLLLWGGGGLLGGVCSQMMDEDGNVSRREMPHLSPRCPY